MHLFQRTNLFFPQSSHYIPTLACQLSTSFDSIAPLVELNHSTNSFLLNAEKSERITCTSLFLPPLAPLLVLFGMTSRFGFLNWLQLGRSACWRLGRDFQGWFLENFTTITSAGCSAVALRYFTGLLTTIIFCKIQFYLLSYRCALEKLSDWCQKKFTTTLWLIDRMTREI